MTTPQPDAARAQAAGARWRTRAFGLEIELSFPAPGLPPASAGGGERSTVAELVPPAEIDRDWPAAGATRVLEERFGDHEPDRTIDAHPEAGYRLYARHFGLARIAPDGSRILCSPPDVEPWSWQRFLVGRILPWAAVLRGLEALHASAVVLDEGAVAFVGATGAGKTSLALRLAVGGAGFLTDDVLALDRADGHLRAHPGASIASIRPEEWDTTPDEWSRLGEVLGHSGKTYLALERHDEPARLAAVYFLRPAERTAIVPIAAPDPRMLLASTFVLGVQTPERLRNQLDVCADLAREVPLFWLDVAPEGGAARSAAAVADHAGGLRGAA
jgi:hypothetical protein